MGDRMCFETIRMRDVYKYIGKANVLIVDLREEKDYIQSHIPGAWNLVYDEEEETKEFIKRIETLITQQEQRQNRQIEKLVLYCDRGNTSMLAARDLYREGIHVVNLYGGYRVYRGMYTKGAKP